MIGVLLTIATVGLAPVAAAAAAGQGAGKSGPYLGKWEFKGKDNTGLVWSGTLDIQRLDPDRFDAGIRVRVRFRLGTRTRQRTCTVPFSPPTEKHSRRASGPRERSYAEK